MKNSILMVLFLLPIQIIVAQQNEIDSLMNVISKQTNDTTEVQALINVAGLYFFINPDSGIIMEKKAVDLARRLDYLKGEGIALNGLGEQLHTVGDFPQALEALFNALRIIREKKKQEIE